jgi:glucosyl-3-phosphoglycerate synthase
MSVMKLCIRTVDGVRPNVQRWFDRRTYAGAELTPRQLLARKTGSISVVVPALNEAATIGPIVRGVRRELVDRVPLVDEVVVVDPGSDDDTAAIAEAAGATVVAEADILPAYGRVPGKGEALWKSLHVTCGDLVVFVDGDLEQFDPALVSGLLGPLLRDPRVSFVKASYDRPLRGGLLPGGGGRVTELVARPLLNAHWPDLAGVAQPLAGECAGRRTLLERLPFVSGYGVELAMLTDVLAVAGLDAIAQVEVGTKVHRHQSDEALGRMAAAIWQTARLRVGAGAGAGVAPGAARLTQFVWDGQDGSLPRPVTSDVLVTERPPMIAVPDYATRRAQAS